MTRASGAREHDRTRERLLLAARRLFADRGFKRVTVREICRAAHANVAAVNYHFGDKMGLYRDVLQQAIDGMVRINETARAEGRGCPPEERLRRFLTIFLSQLARPEFAIYHRLMQRELQDPTPVLDAVAEEGIKPRLEFLAGVVADLVGGEASDGWVMQCVGSINAQALIHLPNPIALRLGYEFKGTPAEIAQVVEHIVAFSIAGVRAVAPSLTRGGAPSPRAAPARGRRGRAAGRSRS